MTSWTPGMVNNAEARLCSLIATNVAAFGQFRVDVETLMDIQYGSGAYGSMSYNETLALMSEDYDWTFTEIRKIDAETNYIYLQWLITKPQN